MKLWLFVLACACFFGLNCDFIVDPGPIVNVTQGNNQINSFNYLAQSTVKLVFNETENVSGAVWPKPFQQKSTHTLYSVVRPELMKFKVNSLRTFK